MDSPPPPSPTLYAALLPQCRALSDLGREHPIVPMMEAFLGEVPNVLAPAALFTGSLSAVAVLVPALMNAPLAMLGLGTDVRSTGMAGFAASARARCAYCVLHNCVLMQRYDDPGAPGAAADGGARTAVQRAAAGLGTALAAQPAVGAGAEARALRAHFSAADVAWHGLFVAAMGFFNALNGILGTAVEPGVARVAAPALRGTEWERPPGAASAPGGAHQPYTDRGWRTTLAILRTLPAALVRDVRATWGVPADRGPVQQFLKETLGARMSVFDRIEEPKVRKALATALRDNLVAPECRLSKRLKYAVGSAFAAVAGNEPLLVDMEGLWKTEKSRLAQSDETVVPDELGEVLVEVWMASKACGEEWAETVMSKLREMNMLSGKEICALMVCLTTFSQPIRTGAKITEAALTELDGSEVMEIAAWASLLACLHRMTIFFASVEPEYA